MNKITRFEFITDKGREIVIYEDNDLFFDLQDDNKTLKVFYKWNK